MRRVVPRTAILLGKATYVVSAVAIALLCITTIIDTASRSIGTGSIAVVFDLNESLIVLVAFLPLAYAQLAGEHVAFTAVYDRLPARAQAVSRLVGYVLAIPLLAWMAWVSMDAAIESWQVAETRMGVANLPVWPARLAVALGLFAFLVTLVYGAVAVLRRWPEYPLEEMAKTDPTEREAR